MQGTLVRSLGQKDPLEKRKATHSSVLAWRIPRIYSPWVKDESDITEGISLTLTWSNVYLLTKGVCESRCLALKSQQTVQVGGKFGLFQMPATEEEDGGPICINRTVIIDSHLQVSHQWSDQHHLSCFRNS